MRMVVYLDTPGRVFLTWDSKNIFDDNLRGGHLGCYSQNIGRVAWIGIELLCKDKVPAVRNIVIRST